MRLPLFVLVLLCSAGITNAQNSTPAVATSSFVVANTKAPDAFLSLRSEPAATSGVRIKQMPNGTKLEVLQRNPDGWWRVKIVPSGEEGWALSAKGQTQWIIVSRDEGAKAAGDRAPQIAPSGRRIVGVDRGDVPGKHVVASVWDKNQGEGNPTNCKIENDWATMGDAKWFGACKDGFASGFGTTRWFKNGILNFEQQYSKASGLIKERGNTVSLSKDIDAAVKLNLAGCAPSYMVQQVNIDANASLALDDAVLINYLLGRSQRLAWQTCPHSGFDVAVDIRVQGKRAVWARAYNSAGPTLPQKADWQEYINTFREEKINRYAAAYLQQVRDQEAIKQAQQRIQAQRQQHELEARVQEQAHQASAQNFSSASVSAMAWDQSSVERVMRATMPAGAQCSREQQTSSCRSGSQNMANLYLTYAPDRIDARMFFESKVQAPTQQYWDLRHKYMTFLSVAIGLSEREVASCFDEALARYQGSDQISWRELSTKQRVFTCGAAKNQVGAEYGLFAKITPNNRF